MNINSQLFKYVLYQNAGLIKTAEETVEDKIFNLLGINDQATRDKLRPYVLPTSLGLLGAAGGGGFSYFNEHENPDRDQANLITLLSALGGGALGAGTGYAMNNWGTSVKKQTT